MSVDIDEMCDRSLCQSRGDCIAAGACQAKLRARIARIHHTQIGPNGPDHPIEKAFAADVVGGFTERPSLNWQTLSQKDCSDALYQIGGALRRMRKFDLANQAEKVADELYPGKIKPAPIVPRTTT